VGVGVGVGVGDDPVFSVAYNDQWKVPVEGAVEKVVGRVL